MLRRAFLFGIGGGLLATIGCYRRGLPPVKPPVPYLNELQQQLYNDVCHWISLYKPKHIIIFNNHFSCDSGNNGFFITNLYKYREVDTSIILNKIRIKYPDIKFHHKRTGVC